MNTIIIDEKLISQMAKGDRNAFREIYGLTSGAVYGFSLSILKNPHDAEDVMHDAYIKMYQSAASYHAKGKPLAWILTIVKNLCYNRIRDGKICYDISQYENISQTDPSENGEDVLLNRMVLEKAMDILDFEERQIVVLHAVTGLKHRETARILELPVGTVLSRYNRALKKLKKELEGTEL